MPVISLQEFPTLMWYTFSEETKVEKVEIKPKRNTEVDNAQWQVFTTDDCKPDSSSRKEFKTGKMASRPVPGRDGKPFDGNQVFWAKYFVHTF